MYRLSNDVHNTDPSMKCKHGLHIKYGCPLKEGLVDDCCRKMRCKQGVVNAIKDN